MTDPDDRALLEGVGGGRVGWDEVPLPVRRAISSTVGSPVDAAVSQERGFSPGLAARLRLRDGRRVFVKAIGPDAGSGAPGAQASYRREAEVTARLPPNVPAPHLLASVDADGWIALVLEDIDGHNPALPWRPADLDRVLDGLTRLAGALTPAPVAVPLAATPGGGSPWARLAADPAVLERVVGPDRWPVARLEDLLRADRDFDDAAAGTTMAHCDLRADNILLTERQVVFVDWPHARQGAPWLDLLYILPSITMQGGPEPHTIFDEHPLGREADPAAVATVLAGFTGFMLHGASQPAPPGIPTLPEFQLAQGHAALRWLRRLMGRPAAGPR